MTNQTTALIPAPKAEVTVVDSDPNASADESPFDSTYPRPKAVEDFTASQPRTQRARHAFPRNRCQ